MCPNRIFVLLNLSLQLKSSYGQENHNCLFASRKFNNLHLKIQVSSTDSHPALTGK